MVPTVADIVVMLAARQFGGVNAEAAVERALPLSPRCSRPAPIKARTVCHKDGRTMPLATKAAPKAVESTRSPLPTLIPPDD